MWTEVFLSEKLFYSQKPDICSNRPVWKQDKSVSGLHIPLSLVPLSVSLAKASNLFVSPNGTSVIDVNGEKFRYYATPAYNEQFFTRSGFLLHVEFRHV